MKNTLYIKDLLSKSGRIDLLVTLVTGEKGLDKEIKIGDINRPGLTLAGFYDFFAYDRIQIFGQGESAYLKQLPVNERKKVCEHFFSYDILCCIFTYDIQPDDIFISYAEKKNVPLFRTKWNTTRFTSQLIHFLDDVFAPSSTIHATMVDVFGIGVLLMGKSGVGKSECALELLERGHRLVADDLVEMKKIDESLLMATGSPILKHHMEIRGLGIINVRDIFGIRSVRNRKRIELIVTLEEWDSSTEYDRLGLEEKKYSILELDVSHLVIPVRPGRNIPIIVETAALNQRLKKLGIHSARELDANIQEWMKMESKKNV